MTGVQFDLEPHQWPPSAQGERLGFADAVFMVEWDGREVEVAARLVTVGLESVLMFFRALESSQVYVVATSFGIRLSPRWHHLISQESKIAFLKEQLSKVLESDKFATYGRLLPLRQSRRESVTLFIAHDGKMGAWIRDFSFGWTPFRLCDETGLTLQTITNPDSPAGYALRWSQLPHAQQCERAVCFANGDWKEFCETVHAVACFGAPTVATPEHWISFGGEFRIRTEQWGFGGHNVGVRLRRWAIYIQDYFAPYRNEQLAAQHLCVAEQSLSPLLSFKLPQPSQHERLEAALTLRAWVKDKIPPHEARLLLPKL